jgi:S1-C subfamily serine protease
MMSRLVRSQFVSALVGGATVAVVFLATGVTGRRSTRTVVEQGPVAAAPASDREGLTPHDIYVRDAPGVVFVRAESIQNVDGIDPFDLYPQQQRSEATGSGFLIEAGSHRYILTNDHVIAGAQTITVQFEDSVTRDAKVVGRSPDNDLALLQADLTGVSARPLALGDSATVQVGDPTLAIGNPFGLDRTLTSGIVSALQRQIQAPNGFSIDNVIQTDAPINPGNSGGPLIDAAGRVIGINSQIATGTGGNGSVGIGFAVPIDTAKEFLPQLETGGLPKIAYLGVSGVSLGGHRHGVLVESAEAGSPAAAAGLRQGDVIEAIGGRAVATSAQLQTGVEQRRPGQTVTLRVRRAGGRVADVIVTLGVRPTAAPVTQGG